MQTGSGARADAAPLTYRGFLASYRTAYAHQGGTKALALGALEPAWFAKLQRELAGVAAAEKSSNVADPAHTTYWTRPIGEARQFSLYNPTGRSDEYLSDFAAPSERPKRLVFPQLESLTRLARLFGRELLNLRLNGLGRQSALSLHEEDPITPARFGVEYRARFHLPIFTTPEARMLLDGEQFRFEEGVLYFFHHGCVHAAQNLSDQPRYHIVLDCELTPELFARLFPGTPSPDAGFRKYSPEQARRAAAGEPVRFASFVTEHGHVEERLDYGRRVPSWIDWYARGYPSLFRPWQRLTGRAGAGTRIPT